MLQTRESEVVASVHQILDQVRRVVAGKDEALLWVLAALLSGGHILLEDVPGVGKTTMALSFARRWIWNMAGSSLRRMCFPRM